ncbi:MAG: YceI family protein [Candidatus Nanopelagicales bacterium]
MSTVELSQENGTLHLHTGVAGRAARMGHNLLIAVEAWNANVEFKGKVPTAVSLTAQLSSLDVVEGHGGVKPLSGGDREQIRANALRSLREADFPTVTFNATQLIVADSGYDVVGALTIAGVTKPLTARITTTDEGDHWRVATSVTVKQTDFDVAPYSAMRGALKLRDEVEVDFEAFLTV